MENPLKRKREELGLTQKQMAEKLGIDVASLSKYENSRIFKTNKLLLIQKFYCLTMEELLEYIKFATELKENK